MRKFLTTALAAITFGGAVAAAAVPAEAQSRYYRNGGSYHHHHSGNDAAVAAVAGIAGLALGAAITSSNRNRGYASGYASGGYASYNNGYYNNGYRYDPRYESYSGDYYARPDRICISRERVWDPYIGRHVTIERQYPC